MKEYAIYKGDDLICIGTSKECAEKLGVKVDTIHFYATKTHHNRGKIGNNRTIAVGLGG